MSKIFKSVVKIIGAVVSVVFPGIGTVIGAALFTAVSVHDKAQARKEAKRAADAAQAINTMVRNSIMYRRIVIGERRVGGMWWYADTTSDKKYFYLQLALCEGPIESIGDILFDNEVVPLDGSGNATGKYEGYVRVSKHLGSNSQVADSDFVSERSDFTSDHRALGVAYISVRLKWSSKKFRGIPNISAVVRGLNNIYDFRDSTTKYTNNSALALAHYLTLEQLGPNLDRDTEIDSTLAQSAANSCDETVPLEAAGNFTVSVATDAQTINSSNHGLHNGQIVTPTSTGSLPSGLSSGTDYYVSSAMADSFKLSATLHGSEITMSSDGTGTHSFTAKERRYTFNGVISTEDNPEEIIGAIATSMAGTAIYTQGKEHIRAGVYVAPTTTILESHIHGDDTEFSPKQSKRDRFNLVKGVWVGAKNRWNPTDYPVVKNSAYITNDGEELPFSLDLAATNSPTMAQRIAKVFLEKARSERSLSIKTSLEMIRLVPGSTCLVTLPRYGLSAVPFDIDYIGRAYDEGKLMIELKLSETASSVYSWSSSEEGAINDAPAPELVDFGDISAPSNMIATNGSGRNLVSVVLSWDRTTDEAVLEGGFTRVRFKKNADSDFQEASIIAGDAESFEITDLEPAVAYDFEVYFQGVTRAESPAASITNHTTAASSLSASAYTHTQPIPSATWVINHNLGYRPGNVAVIDGSGAEVEGVQSVGTETSLTITFNSLISGTAYLS